MDTSLDVVNLKGRPIRPDLLLATCLEKGGSQSLITHEGKCV